MFGCMGFAITIFTIVIVLHISNMNARDNNLQNNLQEAVETSLNTALSEKSYTISDSEELVADVVQGVALYLSNNSELDVIIKKADIATGILSIEIVEHFITTNGNVIDITAEKTIVLEQYETDVAGRYGVSYIVIDTDGSEIVHKHYNLTEMSPILVPANPRLQGFTFSGWQLDGVGPLLSEAEIKALPLDKSYKFYAKFD